jgi:pimeloyl-ACP methyl ester carboxylesterase
MNRVVEALSPCFAEKGFALLVPTQKTWTAWSDSDAKRLLGKTLPDVAKREDVDAERPVLMGFSAGGQMALILYARDPGRFGGLVLDAAYPIDMEAYRQRRMAATKPPADEATKKVPILVLVGDQDGGTKVWDLAEPEWRAAGVPLSIDRVPGGKHEWLARGDHLTRLLTWLGDVAAGRLPGLPEPASK